MTNDASAGPRAAVRRIPTPDERAAELLALERLARRDRRRDLLVAAVEVLVALLVGLYLLGWSFHTTDVAAGTVAFYGGLALGNGGMLLALVRARWRAERRGDTH